MTLLCRLLVDRASRAVGMKLRLRKCAVAHVKHGKYVNGETTFCQRRGQLNEYPREVPTSTSALSNCSLLTTRPFRERLQREYAKRLFKIWSSSLSAKHKVHATNSWAVAVFRYFFPLVKWPHNALSAT